MSAVVGSLQLTFQCDETMSDRLMRLFEIIQIVRQTKRPITAKALSTQLEVTPRTIYRDISSLQVRGIPIAGEAGVGYIMKRGFDLPPLGFTDDEIDALKVGLSLLGRTHDSALQYAAAIVLEKIEATLTDRTKAVLKAQSVLTSQWNSIVNPCVNYSLLRTSIRHERKLSIRYRDAAQVITVRSVLPLVLIYYVDNVLLVAWCELRKDFRHFRVERITECSVLMESFEGDAKFLRDAWSSKSKPFSDIPFAMKSEFKV